jgi:hypothetical protein
VFLACGKEGPKNSPTVRNDIRSKTLRAFFLTPFKSPGLHNGFWAVDQKNFASYIENDYLKGYKPQPNENKPDKIRANLKLSHYFLRLDNQSCDAIFFIEDGNLLASAGELRMLEKTSDRIAYKIVFGSRDAQGNKQVEHAILIAFKSRKEIVLEFPDRKLHFFPDPRLPEDLAEAYAKPTKITDLAEY